MTLVGAAVTPATGQTWAQAISAFETLTRRPMPIRRCYESGVPSSINSSQMAKDLGLRESLTSFKPSLNTSLATMEAFAASIAESEHPCRVIIYHEPVDNMTGDDYRALYARCAPPFREAGIRTGVCYTNWSCNLPYSDPQSALRNYWPGDDAVDFVAFDAYPDGDIPASGSTSTKDALPMDERARRVEQFADARGIELILAEYGVDSSTDVQKSDRWLRSVGAWAEQRARLGKPLGAMCYFSVDDAAGVWHYRLGSHPEYVDSYIDSYRILAG